MNKDRDVRGGGKVKDVDNCYGSDDNGKDDDLRRTEVRLYQWALSLKKKDGTIRGTSVEFGVKQSGSGKARLWRDGNNPESYKGGVYKADAGNGQQPPERFSIQSCGGIQIARF